MHSSTTLNKTKNQPANIVGADPFRPITKRQFLAELKESHEQTLRGEYRDAFVVAAELRQKYGF